MNQTIGGIHVVRPDFSLLSQRTDIVWIITIRDKSVSADVKRLMENQGAATVIENREFVNWLSYKLWLDINEPA